MNPTPLQKVSARLHLESVQPHPEASDGRYPLYRLSGEHRLGWPFRYEMTFVSPQEIPVESLVDTEATLYLEDEKDARHHREIHGRIFEARQDDRVGDRWLYTLTLVHPMHYLGLTQRYEIYQDQTALEIIQTILKRYKALLHLKLSHRLAPHSLIKREYTTQYKQSDLSFIQMLCEQEGITLWMRAETTPYPVILTHATENSDPLPFPLKGSYRVSKRFGVTHAVEDYYDFRAPSKEYLSQTGTQPLAQHRADNPHTSQLRHDLVQMTHRDRLEAPRPKDLQNDLKQSALKGYSDTETIRGHTLSLHAEAGWHAKLDDTKELESTEGIVTVVQLEGRFPNALERYVTDEEAREPYRFEVVYEATHPETPFVPPYQIPKPLIPSSVTAIVSKGSHDTESTPNTIDVDSFGRIRVIFHFDPNYPTSCYIRFANFSAGDGWGSMFIPRVNTEVIVNFLGGDPDRPVAIGSLYNGNNRMSQKLPANKTQSYIKTRSMPGNSQEYNLLLFEDKQHEELVHIRAQKDYKLHALHDATINIDHDQTEAVGHDESFSIGNDRSKSIGHDESTDVGHNRTESVGKDERITIGHDQHIEIGHDQEIHVVHAQTTKIDKDRILYVGNQRQEETYANYTLKTGGHHRHTVNGKLDVKAGEHIKEVTKVHHIDAGERFVAKSAGGTIIIDGSGITLKGNVTIKGNVAITGGSPELVEAISLAAHAGDPICIPCMMKEKHNEKEQ